MGGRRGKAASSGQRRAPDNRGRARRLALVAGGSGFLGGAVSVELARRGWLVGVHFLCGRERAERVADACQAGGGGAASSGRPPRAGKTRACPPGGGVPTGRAFCLRGDLSIRDEAERVVREFETEAGGPPGLVVAATGVVRDAPLLRTSEADWDEVISANLLAPVNVLHAVAVRWKESGGGHAILVGSYAGLVELGGGRAGGAAYSASKAALVGLARTLARELGPPESGGVRVNVVVPPFVTEGMGAGASPEFAREMCARSVLGRTGARHGRVERRGLPAGGGEFAGFVADLAETEGVSGQVLHVDSRIAGA